MFRVSMMAVAALSLLAQPVFAQADAVPPQAAAEPSPAAGAAEAPQPVAAPQPSVVGAPQGPKVETTTFSDWRVECYEPAVNGLKCQMLQQLVERNLDKVVLINSLAYIPSSQSTQIQMVLPLGFLLKRGVELKAGDHSSTIAVDRCTAQGCFIEGIAAPELIAAFRRSNDGVVSIVSDNGQTVRIPFSLAGFSRAYALVEEKNRQAAQAMPVAAAAPAEKPKAD